MRCACSLETASPLPPTGLMVEHRGAACLRRPARKASTPPVREAAPWGGS